MHNDVEIARTRRQPARSSLAAKGRDHAEVVAGEGAVDGRRRSRRWPRAARRGSARRGPARRRSRCGGRARAAGRRTGCDRAKVMPGRAVAREREGVLEVHAGRPPAEASGHAGSGSRRPPARR